MFYVGNVLFCVYLKGWVSMRKKFMKRIVAGVLSASLMFGNCAGGGAGGIGSVAAYADTVYSYADVDGDGTIGLTDAQMVLKAALKIEVLTDEAMKAADVDGDGTIGLSDAQLVLKFALKIANLDDYNRNQPAYRDNYLLYLMKPKASERVEFYTDEASPATIANVAYPYSMYLEREYSHAEFDLAGGYETLCFSTGIIDMYERYSNETDYANRSDRQDAVLEVYGDGTKLGEYKVGGYEPVQNICLDVKGVQELKFCLSAPEDAYRVAVAGITVWKGAAPEDVFPQSEKATQKTSLISRDYIYSTDTNVKVFDGNGTEHQQFSMAGTTFTRGFTFSDSGDWEGRTRCYLNLKNKFKYIGFWIGHEDKDYYTGKSLVTVKADGKLIYEKVVEVDMLREYVCLDVDYAGLLTFCVEPAEQAKLQYTMCGIANLCGSSEEMSEELTPQEAKPAAKLITEVSEPYLYPDGMVDGWGGKLYTGSAFESMTMAGETYHEGLILRPCNTLLGTRDSYACFDLQGVYKNMTFRVGHIDGTDMKNYILKVVGDDRVLSEIPVQAFGMVTDCAVNVEGVHKLKFLIEGVEEMYHGAYGIADIVVYSGDMIENNLFAKPDINYPDQANLLDLMDPYAFRCQGVGESYEDQIADTSEVYYKGQYASKTFTIGNETYHQGFMLEGIVMLDAEGVNMGALIFTALAIAASGSAYKKGYAAFNLHGQYKKLTFDVQALDGVTTDQQLLVGVDDETAAEINLDADGGPQTVTVDLKNCDRLGFVLGGKDIESDWGGRYAIYNVVVEK